MRKVLAALAAIAVCGVLVLALLTRPNALPPADDAGHAVDLENGRIMFLAGGCTSCHAAPGAKGDDKLVLAGGRELKTDFGTFVAPNISPHPEAGIGGWSNDDFVNAMARGVSPDGRHYYPAFPYLSYQRMGRGDLLDLKAYLDTLPASPNVAPDHHLAFPWSLRRGLGLWKLVYLDGEPYRSEPERSEAYNRGKYLVEGPGHCGECHTPRDTFGGPQRAAWLAGAPALEGDGSVPNITPHGDGLASWSASDIAYYLETGFTPDFDSVGGAMVSVQENLAGLPASEREAVATYLKEVPAVPKPR